MKNQHAVFGWALGGPVFKPQPQHHSKLYTTGWLVKGKKVSKQQDEDHRTGRGCGR